MTDKRSEGQFNTTINVGPEGVHKMDSEGVSKVEPSTGKGLFVPFSMTHKETGYHLEGSHLSEEAYNDMVKKHSEKWDIKRSN